MHTYIGIAMNRSLARWSEVVVPAPPIPLSVITSSRFSRFKNPADIVAQVVALSRSSVDASLWADLAATVTHSLDKFTGQDLGTILKKFRGPRNDVMLAGICETVKFLPQFRLLRVRDIADILSGFHRFNFVPSVEVLNVMAAEIEDALEKYSVANGDLCKLLRYFSILERRNSTLCLRYTEKWAHPELVSILREKVHARMGTLLPGQLAVVVQYMPGVSLEVWMGNFARAENTPKPVEQYFFRQLEKQFGSESWREFYYLLRPGQVDSTGWGRAQQEEWDDEDEDELVEKKCERKPPLLQLDDAEVQQVLRDLPTVQRATASQKPQGGMDDDIRENVENKTGEISPEQLAFLEAFEEEMGMIRKPPAVLPFADRQEKRVHRKRDRQDTRGKAVAESTRARIQFKAKKRARLFRFAVLSHVVRESRNS